MKTRDILITVTRTLTGWHVYNDHQFGRITACDPQAGYEITVNLPDSDTIRIVRTQYELVEDNTVLDTADMGEEQALDELARLLSSPMSRTDRLMRLKDKFDRTAEWCRNTLGDEPEAREADRQRGWTDYTPPQPEWKPEPKPATPDITDHDGPRSVSEADWLEFNTEANDYGVPDRAGLQSVIDVIGEHYLHLAREWGWNDTEVRDAMYVETKQRGWCRE